jgi:hypothetical protein
MTGGQEIGTRIYYGEPTNGLGVGFEGMDKYRDFLDYTNYQANCLRNDNVDIKAKDFQGVAFLMSKKSARLFFADMGRTDLVDKETKEETVTSEYGVKLLITIKG